MAKTFQLEIITPTQIFSEGQVNYVRAESPDGQFGIMSHHTAATVALGIGEVKVVKNGKEYFYATTGGFADISGVINSDFFAQPTIINKVIGMINSFFIGLLICLICL